MKDSSRRSIRVALLILLFSIKGVASYADSLRGQIKDSQTGEALVGVVVKLGDNAAVSDTDGNYSFPNIKAGTYNLTFMYLGYRTLEVENRKISGDSVLDVDLEEDTMQLGDALVTARSGRSNDMAVNAQIKEAKVVMSGVSSQQIALAQDKDASQAVRRIPGISVIEDRFVMVRGLSQRYNNVWINNASVPSTEADSRAFSFDIIPSSQIDNLMVVKSQSPEFPADFSGGFVMVNTKDVPEKNSASINVGSGFNTSYITSDFKRAGKDGWSINDIARIPDMNLGGSISHVWRPSGYSLSILASSSISSSGRTIRNMENNLFGTYDIYNDRSLYLRHAIDDQFQRKMRADAMMNLCLISPDGMDRIRWNNLFNHIGSTSYTERKGLSNAQGWPFAQAEYNSNARDIFSSQLSGSHDLPSGMLVEWSAGYAYAGKNQPDRRIWMKTCDGPEEIYLQTGNDISRERTDLLEHIGSTGVNVTVPLELRGNEPVLKGGVFVEYKQRSYATQSKIYGWNPSDCHLLPSRFQYMDIPSLMDPGYMGDGGLYLIDYTNRMNDYGGRNLQSSAYLAADIPLGKVRLYGGLRYEHTYTVLTLNQSRTETRPVDFRYLYGHLFPSLNVTYALSENKQLRASYGRSINRPEFRELSTSVYYDFDLGSDVKGNKDLQPCLVDNIDLRYEWYPSRDEQVSVALFYKHFSNPIEWTYTVTGGTDLCYGYQNAQGANSYGLELDARKNLDSIIDGLSINANMSLIRSRVTFADDALEEDRPMQGQSPYLINVGLFYRHPGTSFSMAMLYNRIGPRLIGVGRSATLSEHSANVPDSYEMPRNSLDFNIAFDLRHGLELRITARDILNEKILFMQTAELTMMDGSSATREEITKSYRPGRSLNVSLTYNF